ncbi:MAG: sensor histidine kinase [Oscillospiraceae bacterium]
MSDVLSNLESLFRLSAAPVIGIRENFPVYCNPAAEKFFSGKISKSSASELFPRWPYGCDSVISTTVLERNCIITVTKIEDVIVLTIAEAINEETISSIPVNALAVMASTITTLRMAVDRLVDMCGTGKQQDLYISILYQNYYKLLRVAEHLMVIAGLTVGSLPFNPKPLELGTFISDIVSSVRYLTSDLNIKVEYVPPEELITVNADAELIEQLILGLIANSINNMPNGGKITLRVSENMGNAVISVDDDGCGIAPEALSSLFRLKNPTHPLEVPASEGGLGLPLASVIAAKHGGTIMLDSHEGTGTSIRVMLKSSDNPLNSLHANEYVYGNPIPSHALTELSTVLHRSQYAKEKILGK